MANFKLLYNSRTNMRDTELQDKKIQLTYSDFTAVVRTILNDLEILYN